MDNLFSLSMGVFDGVFAVPFRVTDSMKRAPGEYLKPLLALLRQGGAPLSEDELCRLTGLTKDTVENAMDYWVSEGILLRQEGQILPDTVPAFRQSDSEPEPVEDAPAEKEEIHPEPPAPISLPEPVTSPEEFNARVENDSAMRFLLQEAQRIFGRTISRAESASLVSLTDNCGLSPDVVVMLLSYCREIGKSNMKYVLRLGEEWGEKELETHEQVEAWIRRKNAARSREAEILAAFGLDKRSLSARETEYVSTWYDSYGYDLRMIRLAFDRSVDNTGKMSFSYINKVLQNWHEKGFREPRDLQNEQPPERTKESSPAKNPKKGAAQQTGPSTIDYDLADDMLYWGGDN